MGKDAFAKVKVSLPTKRQEILILYSCGSVSLANVMFPRVIDLYADSRARSIGCFSLSDAIACVQCSGDVWSLCQRSAYYKVTQHPTAPHCYGEVACSQHHTILQLIAADRFVGHICMLTWHRD